MIIFTIVIESNEAIIHGTLQGIEAGATTYDEREMANRLKDAIVVCIEQSVKDAGEGEIIGRVSPPQDDEATY
jgi:hypothetical protein